jgi:hypothetical protein
MTELDEIINPRTVRARTARIFEQALNGKTHFEVHLDKLTDVVTLVESITRKNYPTLAVPLHGRFEHLRAGAVDRIKDIADQVPGDAQAKARTLVDLVTTSVLLDAGAGMAWRFQEAGQVYAKSEGLAVASAALFRTGAMSHDQRHPLQATAIGLQNITFEHLSNGFQVTLQNPLLGVQGRLSLLQRLGQCVASLPHQRPGGLLDVLLSESQPVPASMLLKVLLTRFASMWPARVTIEGVGFGDVWPYEGNAFANLIPFHKLSQWLAYSLIEPLQLGGVRFSDIDALTGLPEYRNGGLFLDSGVLKLRDPAHVAHEFGPHDALIIEWRALTIQLLDRVADTLRGRLNMDAATLPLAKVLQGGTWTAGRVLAQQKRADGGPPLHIQSDGMVF